MYRLICFTRECPFTLPLKSWRAAFIRLEEYLGNEFAVVSFNRCQSLQTFTRKTAEETMPR